mmetsp:Transcript_76333/g.181516  ORF Transcript_76333/g.181516 Transcript_76333/m.181516 type:complete len:217 (-) Transcript_76333:1781-2431(-)
MLCDSPRTSATASHDSSKARETVSQKGLSRLGCLCDSSSRVTASQVSSRTPFSSVLPSTCRVYSSSAAIDACSRKTCLSSATRLSFISAISLSIRAALATAASASSCRCSNFFATAILVALDDICRVELASCASVSCSFAAFSVNLLSASSFACSLLSSDTFVAWWACLSSCSVRSINSISLLRASSVDSSPPDMGGSVSRSHAGPRLCETSSAPA